MFSAERRGRASRAGYLQSCYLSFVSCFIYMQVRFLSTKCFLTEYGEKARRRKGGKAEGRRPGRGWVNAHHSPRWTLMEKLPCWSVQRVGGGVRSRQTLTGTSNHSAAIQQPLSHHSRWLFPLSRPEAALSRRL